MAINIFQGSKPQRSQKGSASSSSVRAKNAQAALTVPSVTSDSGTTAVGKSGTLSKVGKVVGSIAGVASKFLPGLGGTIAKGISNIFNDPEWWQSVPGDAVTLNSPLRIVETTHKENFTGYKAKFAIGEFCSMKWQSPPENITVFEPTETQITQYLLPEIRKVVNAIPLQTAAAYGNVLRVNATLYALWQNLKKYDYMLKHGQTYIANLNDKAFPILQVENAAWLQSTIGRLEEYLRANVRLPHTLCEYLGWRFGRIYKSNSSAKSGLILYNVISIANAIEDYELFISMLMSAISLTTETQQANADIYNTYFDHDYMVEIRDDTQFRYDVKEFCLRTNLDIRTSAPTGDPEDLDCVYIDSALDNPTTYMASTVSTVGRDIHGGPSWLFPVRECICYIPKEWNWAGNVFLPKAASAESTDRYNFLQPVVADSLWYKGTVYPFESNAEANLNRIGHILGQAMLCKALDIYNKDIYVAVYPEHLPVDNVPMYLDVTALSMDMGLVANTTLGNEHVYAFANLVAMGRKHSMSYREAETLVARDTANLIERLDVGASK